MHEVLQRFVAFGMLGLLIENLFTGLWQIVHGDFTGRTKSYLWMFIIYGIGGLSIELISSLTHYNIFIKAVLDTIFIYFLEFTSGWTTEFIFGKCLWKYMDPKSETEVHRRSIMGMVRYDYCLLWYGLAVVFELYGQKFATYINMLSRL